MCHDSDHNQSSQALGTAEPYREFTFIAGVLFVVPDNAEAIFFPLEEIHNEIAISHCFGDSNLPYYVIGFGLFILYL